MDAGGNLLSGVVVTASLYPGGVYTYSPPDSDDAIDPVVQKATSNVNGVWSLSLERTDTMEPSGMVYLITRTYAGVTFSPNVYITVPSGGGTLLELMTTAPVNPTQESVVSVFGRTGAVVAESGDYTASQVGADPAGTAAAVETTLDAAIDAVASQDTGGDLSGDMPTPTVVGIYGHPVSSTAPLAGQVPEWNGSAYVPTTAVTGMLINGLAGYAGIWYVVPNGPTAVETGTENDEIAQPLLVTAATTIQTVGVYVGTASSGGSSVGYRIGIRNDSGNGQPGTLVHDCGLLALTSTGYVHESISGGLTLQPGTYWITNTYQYSSAPSTTPTVYSVAGFYGWSVLSLLVSPGSAPSPVMGFYQTGVSGGLGSGFTIAGYSTPSSATSPAVIFVGT